MKREIVFVVMACISILYSCRKETMKEEPLTISKKSGNHSDNNFVPFKGYYVTRAEFLASGSERIVGMGQASHLGESKFVSNAVVNRTTPPPFSVAGTAVFTAANGDEFFTSFTGLSMPLGNGMIRANLTHTITGGTGRFSDVTGTLTAVALVNLANPTNQVWYEGSINY